MLSSLFGLVLIGMEPKVEALPSSEPREATPKKSEQSKKKGKGKKKGKKKGKSTTAPTKSSEQSSPPSRQAPTRPQNDMQTRPSAALDARHVGPNSSSTRVQSEEGAPSINPKQDSIRGGASSTSTRTPKRDVSLRETRVVDPTTQPANSATSSSVPPPKRAPSQRESVPRESVESPNTPTQTPRLDGGRTGNKPSRKPDVIVRKPSWTPDGWTPRLHQTRPSSEPAWSPNHWGRGYFVFSPPKKGKKVKVVEQSSSGENTSTTSTQRVRRDVDRRGMAKIGPRASSYMSSYSDGLNSGYADFGAGGAIGYRIFEPIGVEVSYSRFAPEFDFEDPARMNSTLQGSAQLYLFPWTRVSPYLSGGYTVDKYNIQDAGISEQGVASGPHGGIGVEVALGKHLSLGVESRYVRYKNLDTSAIRDDALQVFGGVDIYF